MTKLKTLRKVIINALKEDNAVSDITAKTVVGAKTVSNAYVMTKSEGIVCGLGAIREAFRSAGWPADIKLYLRDGQTSGRNNKIALIRANTRHILALERTILNILQHLSGVSTLTHKFVAETRRTRARILDTRKTLPGLRELEKYAVRCGGGANHRMNLSQMAMIKDNHLKVVEDLTKAVNMIKTKYRGIKVEVECRNLDDVKNAIISGGDIIMLDNMDMPSMKSAIKLIRSRVNRNILIEVSGGVNLSNVKRIARLGVDRISVGALTHSAPALDISMKIF